MHHNQIIAVLQEHGFAEGRLIANSKSGYYKRHRSHFAVFNAQVCNIRGRLLKQADLDLTLDGERLTQASICVRRAKWWDCFGPVAFLLRKLLPRRGGGCSDVLQKAQPRRGPPQPSRRLGSHPASGKNYEQKTCRNSSWGFCLALVLGNSKTDAVEGDTAHGRSHYLRRLGV